MCNRLKSLYEDLGKISFTIDKDNWSASKKYERLTIVETPNGYYVSMKDVPSGIEYTNTNYWKPFNANITKVISVESLVNNPDEEDLTEVNNELKLKNRTNNNKVGYVILREGINITDQLNLENTIYEVRYNFDLDGETIILPNNSIFFFTGGSFANGTLVGDCSSIIGTPTYNIFNDTLLKKFNLEYLDLRWFGAIEGEDCADAFDNCIATFNQNVGVPIRVIGHYTLSRTITCVQGLIIDNPSIGYYPEVMVNFTSGKRLTPYIKPDGNTNYVGTINVADEITAFLINPASSVTGSVDWAYQAAISIKGMNFICNAGVDYFKISDDNGIENVSGTLIEYNCGGWPTGGLKIIDTTIKGFKYAFNFSGGISHYGSMASCILFDNVDFKFNNYSIYTHTKKETEIGTTGNYVHNISFTNLDIERCKFEHGSRLHIEGLYGSNFIRNSIIQGTKDPFNITINSGNLVFEGMYIEDVTGNAYFSKAEPTHCGSHSNLKLSDSNSSLKFGEIYYHNATNTIVEFYMKELTILSIPSQVSTYRLHFEKCSLENNCVERLNKGMLTTNNIVLKSTEYGNDAGVIVLKTLDFKTINTYDVSHYDASYLGRGYFRAVKSAKLTWNTEEEKYENNINDTWTNDVEDLDIKCRLDSHDNIILGKLDVGGVYPHRAPTATEKNNLILPMVYNRLPAGSTDFLDKDKYYNFTFYKCEGSCYFNLYAGDDTEIEDLTLVESVELPMAEGACLVRIGFGENIPNMKRVGFRRGRTDFDGDIHRISSVWIKMASSHHNLRDSMLVPSAIRNGRTHGTTEQRPDIVTWCEDDATVMARYNGTHYFDSTIGKQLIWKDNRWVDTDGNDADVKSRGTTEQRPELTSVIVGFTYFDTTLNKFIVSDGEAWRYPDGTLVE